ncbi:MAG TPA: SIMPL domain-containing protein [Dehalococcoidia bacterium]|nr:SIMPL domain-containing protein [Dehalococcoidia bacterium]
MNLKVVVSGFVAVLALALLSVACGGDDGGDAASIRTQKGLAVAAVSGQLGGDEATGRSSGAPAPSTDDGAESDRSSGGGADLGFKGVDFAPAFQAGQTGITVQGYGSATTDPDSAILEFYFSRSGGAEPMPVPEPGTTSSGSNGAADTPETISRDAAVASQAAQITEAELQAVIDALVGAGVARGDIEFIGQTYYDVYYASATLRADVGNVDNVDGVVQAGQAAAANLGDIYLSSTNVSYTVSDCAALEKAAMDAAVEDANERGASFASSLGVGLGGIVGASHYSYSPYGGTACDGNFVGPYPMGGVAYAEGATASVQVFANISVTFAIQ